VTRFCSNGPTVGTVHCCRSRRRIGPDEMLLLLPQCRERPSVGRAEPLRHHVFLLCTPSPIRKEGCPIAVIGAALWRRPYYACGCGELLRASAKSPCRGGGSACPRARSTDTGYTRCSGDPGFRISGDTVETNKAAQRFRDRRLNDLRSAARPTRSTDRRIRHHPPANIDSHSKS
jgi:hypothetical protein